MLEIYTIYGGGMWKTALDAVVTLVGQNTFHTLMRIAGTFGVLAVLLTFIKQRNPMVFVQWLAIFMILTTILLVPKRSVQIIDLSDPAAVWKTDNVPVGLAAIASLTTSIGYKMASVYDMLMARPDSVTYSKTGMLFGSQIVAETSDFTTQNPELAQMLPDYVENCVIGDILLNGKYTINQLLNSTDPLTLITSNPSPLRGIFKMTSTSRQFLTCQQAATEIKTLANTDVNPGSATFTWLTRKVFGNKLNGASLLANAMGESYGFFYAGGMTAAQIMKNNITNSAVRQGIKGFAARSSDTATGYGAQGASSDYVIALEGTKDGRKALASRRAFYISASRVKEHVQIYTDGKADWVKAVKTPERDIKTAHDALAPETQRKQAKAIWAMGQPVNKTAIGRAWVRHQGMQDASLTAKIIPATRRFPEPALALPVYDNNGRSAGLALVSLVASPEGRMTQGETRMVMTERARGAVLQRSQSGNTIVASDLTAALDAVRNNPKDGVVWQTGDEPPSAWLLKVSGGTKQDVSPGIVSTLTDEQSVQQLREQMLADLVRNEEASRSRQPESLLAEVPQEEVIRLKPEDINPRKPEPLNPDADVIARVRGEENTDGREIKAAAGVRSELEGADKASGEQSRASRVIADLANAERDMLRAAENTERGRTPEREEQTLTRTIQKER